METPINENLPVTPPHKERARMIKAEDLSLLSRKYHASRASHELPAVPERAVVDMETEIIADPDLDATGEPVALEDKKPYMG